MFIQFESDKTEKRRMSKRRKEDEEETEEKQLNMELGGEEIESKTATPSIPRPFTGHFKCLRWMWELG